MGERGGKRENQEQLACAQTGHLYKRAKQKLRIWSCESL